MNLFKQITVLFFLLIGANQTLSSQAYQDVFSPSFADYAINATTTTQQQKMLSTGIVRPHFAIYPNFPTNLFVRKTDVWGAVDWHKVIIADCDLYPNSIQQMDDQSIVIAGEATKFDGVTEQKKMFILKLDKNGNQTSLHYYNRQFVWNAEHQVNVSSRLNDVKEAHGEGIIAVGTVETANYTTQFYQGAAIVLKTDG